MHSFIVGFGSCEPTVIQSNEQKSLDLQWFLHSVTVHLMLSFGLQFEFIFRTSQTYTAQKSEDLFLFKEDAYTFCKA